MDLVHRLRGMFVIAVYDRLKDDVYLIRDHFGIKPLYYADRDGWFVFASEIRSILASGVVRPEVDPQSLWYYLTFQYVPDPGTMLRGIRKLAPAHYLRLHAGKVDLHRYWKYEFHPDPTVPFPELVNAVKDRLRESVRLHTMSDVPIGAYLSSGVDSGAIVTLLRERGQIDTFSVGFADSAGEADETVLAGITARALGTRHHEVHVTARRYQETWPRIIASQEDVIGDPSAPALYFLAEAAKPHVKVVLSGEGADELFGGYPIYGEPNSLRVFDYLPGHVRSTLGTVARFLPPGIKGQGFLERGSLPVRQRYLGNARIFSEKEKGAFVTASPGAQGWGNPLDLVAPYYEATEHVDDITGMQTVDGCTWLPGDILMKADKMAMAHSVELRVPFLDIEVFKTAAVIPARYRVANGTTKYALRQALKGILPSSLADRPKRGFPVPIGHWLSHDMRDFARDVINSSRSELLDRKYIRELLDGEGRPVRNRDRKIWTILTFILWHREFIEQAWQFTGPGSADTFTVFGDAVAVAGGM